MHRKAHNAQLPLFDLRLFVSTQEETQEFCPASLTRGLARVEYKSIKDCLCSKWPFGGSKDRDVTLYLRGKFGEVTETGSGWHILDYRCWLAMAGIGQEVV